MAPQSSLSLSSLSPLRYSYLTYRYLLPPLPSPPLPSPPLPSQVDEEDDELVEERDADAELLLEKLKTVTEFFDTKNDQYSQLQEKYDKTKKVGPYYI